MLVLLACFPLLYLFSILMSEAYPLFMCAIQRFLLKQVVTMEVIQWTSLWNTYKDEFENEKSMLGGSLGDKAAEDLRQRIIEHVSFPLRTGQLIGCCFTCQYCCHYSFAT